MILLPSAFPPPCRDMSRKGFHCTKRAMKSTCALWKIPSNFQKKPYNFTRKLRFGGVPEALGRGLGVIWVPRAMQDNKKGFVVPLLRLPKVAQRVQNRARIIKKSDWTFDLDFEWLCIDYGSFFCSKNLSKIGGLRVVISTSLRICEKYDFERPSIVFATFFKVESIDFRSQNVYFSNVFLKVLLRRAFSWFWIEFWYKWEARWTPKSTPRPP